MKQKTSRTTHDLFQIDSVHYLEGNRKEDRSYYSITYKVGDWDILLQGAAQSDEYADAVEKDLIALRKTIGLPQNSISDIIRSKLMFKLPYSPVKKEENNLDM